MRIKIIIAIADAQWCTHYISLKNSKRFVQYLNDLFFHLNNILFTKNVQAFSL